LDLKDSELLTVKNILSKEKVQSALTIRNCNEKLSRLSSVQKTENRKSSEAIAEKSKRVNNLMEQLNESNNIYLNKFHNEIQRGHKINENLDLIIQKIEDYKKKSSGLSKEEIHIPSKDKEKEILQPKFKEVSTFGSLMKTTSETNEKSLTEIKTKASTMLDMVLFEGTNKGNINININII
jgi:hypothetical protein